MKALAALAAGLVALVLAAVSVSAPERACPAIGWLDQLVVQLAVERPTAHAVQVECPTRCGLTVPMPEPGAAQPDGPESATVELTGGTATASFLMGAPDSVTVRVLDTDGTVLAATEAEPDWVRVGGSAECGGPHEATVTIR